MGLLFSRALLPRIEQVAWIWLAVCLSAFAFQSANNVEWSEPVQAAGLFTWAPLFFSGCMFYRIKHGQATWKTHLLVLACSLTYAIVVVSGLLLGIRHVAAIIAIYAIFYLVVFNRLKWLAIKPLVFLGTISYSLYIFHARVGSILLTALRTEYDVPFPIALSITCAAALIAATAITFLIERPANRVIRAWWKSRNVAGARSGFGATGMTAEIGNESRSATRWELE
jgi:peptidoglycan/LPS O-acetylase OafA/YrhL